MDEEGDYYMDQNLSKVQIKVKLTQSYQERNLGKSAFTDEHVTIVKYSGLCCAFKTSPKI